MLNLKHPNSNAFHGAPSNWNGEPIDTLPTVSARGGHASFWQFDPEEIERIVAGGSVQLTIYAPQHPVISLAVIDWPETRHDATGAPLTLVTVGDDAGVAMLTTEEVETLNTLRTGEFSIEEFNRMKERLCIDPGGSDEIDVLNDVIEQLRETLERWQSYGCPNCSGDCCAANPSVTSCIMDETNKALRAGAARLVTVAEEVAPEPVTDAHADHFANVWKKYEADFNAMTDKEIRQQVRESEEILDEAESWLEAVASWEAAGRPRKESGNG